VRWTGMPAWGEPGDDPDSWKLVLFHPPSAQPVKRRTQGHGPLQSIQRAEREEQKQEEDFLNGGPAEDAAPKQR